MKQFFGTIHLYLGLIAGLIILLSCLTGAILVFEKELQQIVNRDRYFIEIQGVPAPLAQLVSAVQMKVPNAKISSIKLYDSPDRTAELNYAIPGKKELGKKDSKSNQKIAFVNPYTTQVVELYTYRDTFFYQVFALHRWLWAGNIGKLIVGTSSIVFLFILITGIILWFPKTRQLMKQRLKIKWNGSAKRLIHDFHVVLGFYTAIFLFIPAFTGLVWSFKWFNNGVYWVTNSSMKPIDPPQSELSVKKVSIGFDEAYRQVKNRIPHATSYTIVAPKDSTLTYSISVLPLNMIENKVDDYYIDQYTARVVKVLTFGEKNLGQRVRSMFKPVHTASVFGGYSKWVGFVVCLLGVTFPVTGTLMWINRWRKKSKKASL